MPSEPELTVLASTSVADGPRERLTRLGPAALSDAELIALLLGTGAPGEPVGVVAARMVAALGGLGGVARAGLGQLSVHSGVGRSKAARILAAIELGRRTASPREVGPRLTSSRAVDAALRPRLGHREQEQFVALALDAKNRVSAELLLGVGGLCACPVSPADVYRALVREAAAAVIFCHNHPSGEPSPSAEDIALTERLRLAGDLLGIRVLDHVIVARDGYFSFLDEGLLAPSSGAA